MGFAISIGVAPERARSSMIPLGLFSELTKHQAQGLEAAVLFAHVWDVREGMWCRAGGGLCYTHRKRMLAGEDIGAPIINGGHLKGRKCTYPNCENKHAALGYCTFHYKRLKNGTDLSKKKNLEPLGNGGPCQHQPCPSKARRGGYCGFHYKRLKNGVPLDAKRKRGKQAIGALRVNVDGYVDMKIGGNTWIKQHKYMMEQIVGRPLSKGEEVHHKNGMRSDNRIENLELWSKSHPYGQRVIDKIKWAEDLLKLYKPQRRLFEDLPLG